MFQSAASRIALLAVVLALPTFARTETVTGVLIDLNCYAQNKENIGNAHKATTAGGGYICGQACAREGFAVAVLTTDGKVYQVAGELAANSNAKLVPHIAQTVGIGGDVSEEGGMMLISANELTVIKK